MLPEASSAARPASSPASPRRLIGAAALVLVAAGAPDAAGQAGATTGVIRGIVRDPIGQPMPNAVIVILHRETDLQSIVETTPAGTFVRTLLPPGTYDLTVTADGGYGVERIEGAALRVGETLDLGVDLRVVAAETVTVAADTALLVSTADVTSSQRVAEEVVDRLPSNGRNYLDLALLTPGASISQGPDGDVLNIAGQRGIFNNVIVDGADFNNPFFGEQRGGQRPAFTFNQDAIEEIVVVNQGATAEFGRSAGGFVNVITKSGTNDPSGSAHYFGQWDEISAAYSRERGGGEPDFGRSQLGGTLGGTLVRDRASTSSPTTSRRRPRPGRWSGASRARPSSPGSRRSCRRGGRASSTTSSGRYAAPTTRGRSSPRSTSPSTPATSSAASTTTRGPSR